MLKRIYTLFMDHIEQETKTNKEKQKKSAKRIEEFRICFTNSMSVHISVLLPHKRLQTLLPCHA